MVFLIIAAVVVLAALGWVVYVFNSLVKLRALCRNAWSDIEIQLRRRHNLVPNLVETVKGYMAHERTTLEEVTRARARATEARTVAERGENEQALSAALRQLFALAESYPELKASANFLELQAALVEIENTIQQARRYYNAVVRDYNIRRQVFPASLVAGAFGFGPLEYFAAEEEDREPVAVTFAPGGEQ